jgi:hypothetical protein
MELISGVLVHELVLAAEPAYRGHFSHSNIYVGLCFLTILYLYSTQAVMKRRFCLEHGSHLWPPAVRCFMRYDTQVTGRHTYYTGFKEKAFGVFVGTLGIV